MRLINQGVQDKRRLYNALMRYVYAGGKKLQGLVNRRTKEAILLTEGVYAGDGKASIFPVSNRGYPVYRKGKTIDVMPFLKEPEKVTKKDKEDIKKCEGLGCIINSKNPLTVNDVVDIFQNWWKSS